jgi:hypothetical protein
MEFRAENATALKTFRRSMLQYAGDLNGKIKDVSPADFEQTTKFFIQTEVVPVMDALRSSMNDPARPWYNRVTDHAKVLAELGASSSSRWTRPQRLRRHLPSMPACLEPS